jgi:hypothetical protein
MSVFKFELKVNGIPVPAEASQGFRSIRYVESIENYAHFKLHIGASDWSFFDNVILNNDSRLQMRFIVVDEDGNETSSPWKTCLCGTIEVDYHPVYADYFIEGFDGGHALEENCSKLYFDNIPVSDMVSQIADIYKLSKNILPVDTGNKTFHQGWESDGEFIRDYCLRYAAARRRKDYLYYVRNGDTLVFAPPDYTQDVYRTIGFNIDKTLSELESVKVLVRRVETIRNGAGNVLIRAFHPSAESFYEEILNSQNVNYEQLASQKPTFSGVSTIEEVATEDTENRNAPWKQVVDTLGTVHWSQDYLKYLTVPMRIFPAPDLTPGMIIRLNIVDQNGSAHFSSGKYLAHTVEHSAIESRYETTVTLVRRDKAT